MKIHSGADTWSIEGWRCFYRPAGEASAEDLVYLIAGALIRGVQENAEDALIDITGMSGFEVPGPGFRRWAVAFWSEAIGNELRIAMVAPRDLISPERVGILAAAEVGLHAEIFDNDQAAVAWLDTQTARG